MSSSASQVSERAIAVTVKVPGFHHWPDAPQEVAFLREQHRHIFTVKCIFEVKHDDRDLEFFIVQRHIRAALKECCVYTSKYEAELQFGPRSCEHIAVELHEVLARWGLHARVIEVWEDDENGALISFDPPAVTLNARTP